MKAYKTHLHEKVAIFIGGFINISPLIDKRFNDNKTTINSLFEIEKKNRHHNGISDNNDFEPTEKQITRYSQNAIIYQAILKYSITFGTREYFDLGNIAQYLLKECSMYENFYLDSKTNESNKRYHVKTEIKPLLENLIFLELVESREANKSEMNRENELFYSFTEYGRLIGLMIKLDENISDPSIYNEIIKQFVALRKTKNDSASLFSSLLFHKINDDLNFVKKFVDDLTTRIKNPDFDDQLKFLEKVNNDIIKLAMSFSKLYNYFVESLEELEKIDRRKYEMFMHKFKRILERFQEIKCYDNSKFEEMRMRNRYRSCSVTVEGSCDSCNNLIYTRTRLTKFLQIAFNDSSTELQDRCSYCHKGKLDYSYDYLHPQ